MNRPEGIGTRGRRSTRSPAEIAPLGGTALRGRSGRPHVARYRAEFGHRVVAVVLSGTLSDGVAGAKAVSQAGGIVIVQDPSRAVFPDLPWNAITRDHPDRVLPPEQIAAEISAQVERMTQEVAVGENE